MKHPRALFVVGAASALLIGSALGQDNHGHGRFSDDYVKDAIAVALGEAGDLEQHARIAGIASRQSDGYLRMECIRALYQIGAPEARQVTMEMAASDPFIVVIGEKPHFLAREYAKEMLHSLDLQAAGRVYPGWDGKTVLQYHRDMFEKWLSGYDPFLKRQTGSSETFVKEHASDLARLLRVCNGDLGPIGP